jgi:hypothetical protein
MDVIGRRKAGVTAAQANSDLQSVASVLAARDAKWHADASLRAVPLRDVIVGSVRPTIRALLGAVALVALAWSARLFARSVR